MGILRELPTDVLELVTDFLEFMDVRHLHETGSSVLRTKLSRGGVSTIRVGATVLGLMQNTESELFVSRACSLGLLRRHSTLRHIIFDSAVNPTSWWLQMMQQSWISLSTLKMTLSSSIKSLFQEIESLRIILSVSMPNLSHLSWKSNVKQYEAIPNFVWQFILGTLPETLITFEASNERMGGVALDPWAMTCQLPATLETFGVSLSYINSTLAHFEQDMQIINRYPVKLGIRRIEQVEFGQKWNLVFPLSLTSMIFFDTPFTQHHHRLPDFLLNGMPHRLLSLEVQGFDGQIDSSCFPPSLTSLVAENAMIRWQNNSLPCLKYYVGKKPPVVDMPTLEMAAYASPVYSVLPGSMPRLHTLKDTAFIYDSPTISELARWIRKEAFYENLTTLALHSISRHPEYDDELEIPVLPPNLTSLAALHQDVLDRAILKMLPASLLHLDLQSIRTVDRSIFDPLEEANDALEAQVSLWPKNLRTLRLSQIEARAYGKTTLIPAKFVNQFIQSLPGQITSLQFEPRIEPIRNDPALTMEANWNLSKFQKQSPHASVLLSHLEWPKQLTSLELRTCSLSIPALLDLATREMNRIVIQYAVVLELEELLEMPILAKRLSKVECQFTLMVAISAFEEALARDRYIDPELKRCYEAMKNEEEETVLDFALELMQYLRTLPDYATALDVIASLQIACNNKTKSKDWLGFTMHG